MTNPQEPRVIIARGDDERRLITAIGVCLDRSGSMGQRDRDGGDKRDAAIAAYNGYLAEQQRETADDALWSRVEFADSARVVATIRPIALAEPLTRGTYVPGGSTALHDAIVFAMEDLERTAADRYLVVVLTDGENNSSRTTRDELRAAIAEREARGNWTFVYLSAAESGFTDGTVMGFGAGNIAAIPTGMSGSSAAWVGENASYTSHATSHYRQSRDLSVSGFYNTDNTAPSAADTD